MNLTCRVDAIGLRQRNVHDNDVRLQGRGLGDRLGAVGRLTHNLKRLSTEQFPQASARHRMVINDQDPQNFQHPTPWVVDVVFLPTRVAVSRLLGVGSQTWASPRYCQDEPCSLPRRALDVHMTTKQSKAL